MSGVEQTRIGMPSDEPSRQTKSPTSSATRYDDIFGVRANVTVCLPGSGPGVSFVTLPFEIAVSPASTVIEMS